MNSQCNDTLFLPRNGLHQILVTFCYELSDAKMPSMFTFSLTNKIFKILIHKKNDMHVSCVTNSLFEK